MKYTFGQLIESLRKEKGLSVYALAQQAGLSKQAIHHLEQSNHQQCTLETVRRLAHVLGFSLDWMDSQLPKVELPQPAPVRPRGRPAKAKPAERGPKTAARKQP
jgi:transcriptional regulator with XRE-family HTH domain